MVENLWPAAFHSGALARGKDDARNIVHKSQTYPRKGRPATVLFASQESKKIVALHILGGNRVGLFDMLLGGKARDEKRSQKALTVVKNAKAIREDRVAAIEFFKNLGDMQVAVPALLQRFEYSIEHGINDTREKESAMDGIVTYGQDALPLIKEHLLKTNRIAWPIKVLKALGQEEQVIEVLKSALDFGDVAFDQIKVDKNYDILCYLRDYKLPGFAGQLAHFLADHDERVRFAATEVLADQDDPKVPELLEKFIGDASPDNTRIRQTVVEAFLRHQWSLRQPERFPDGRIVEGLIVNNQKKLEIRV